MKRSILALVLCLVASAASAGNVGSSMFEFFEPSQVAPPFQYPGPVGLINMTGAGKSNFQNTTWWQYVAIQDTTFSTHTLSPDGVSNAQKLIADSTSVNGHKLVSINTIAITPTNTGKVVYRVAFDVAAAEYSRVRLVAYDQTSVSFCFALYDLAGGAVVTTNTPPQCSNTGNLSTATVAASIVPIGTKNGIKFYRCILDVGYSVSTTLSFELDIDNGTGQAAQSIVFAGNGVNGVWVWEANVLPKGAWSMTNLNFNYSPTSLAQVDVNNTRNQGYSLYSSYWANSQSCAPNCNQTSGVSYANGQITINSGFATWATAGFNGVYISSATIAGTTLTVNSLCTTCWGPNAILPGHTIVSAGSGTITAGSVVQPYGTNGTTGTGGPGTYALSQSSTVSTAQKMLGEGYVGQSFSAGGYFECTMNYNPANAPNNSLVGWPVCWIIDNRILSSEDFNNGGYEGNGVGFEVDLYEAFPSGTAGAPQNFLNNHDWVTSSSQAGSGGGTNNAVNLTLTNAQMGNPTFTSNHRYGALWVPIVQNDNVNGVIMRFFDGVFISTATAETVYSGTTGSAPAATPSNPNGIFSESEISLFNFLIGAGTNYPMSVSNMTVYQPNPCTSSCGGTTGGSIVPVVNNVAPASGASNITHTVTVTGTNLSSPTAVKFGPFPAVSFTGNTATSLTAVSPVQGQSITAPNGTLTDGTGAVWSWGSSVGGGLFNLLRNGVSVGSASLSELDVNGVLWAFQSSSSTWFMWNGSGFTNEGSTAPTTIGTVDVTVTTANGTSATNAGDQFTYTTPPTFQGVGDIAASKGYSYNVWYGSRAFSSTKAGQALFNVCVNNDANCAIMVSSSVTGDIVPQTIGGILCGGPSGDRLGSCTIKTAYDLTKSTASGGGSGGVDITQPTISLRPVLMAQALPLIGSNRTCMWFPDQPHYLVSTSTVSWGTTAMTMSLVAVNQSGGVRTNNPVYNIASANYNQTTQAIPLQPGTHFDPNLRWFQADGGNEGVGGEVTLYSTIFVDDGSFGAAKAFILDQMPHTINAAFNGASSSIMIDGVLTSGLSIGTNAFPTDTVSMGSSFSNQTTQPEAGNIFEGVICEAGFANGDQSAFDSAIDANQTAYWLTPTAPTPVFNWTATFDGVTAGTQVTLSTMASIFTDSSVSFFDNSNYAQSSNPSGTQCLQYTGSGGNCVPAPTVLISIVGNLPAGGTSGTNALMMEMQTGDCGTGINGAGLGQMNVHLGTVNNILVTEADMMFVPAAQAPNGLDFDFHGTIGKTGFAGFYSPPGVVNGTSNEPLWTAPGAGGSTHAGFVSAYVASDGIVNAQPNYNQATPPFPGTYNVGVWYHTKFEVATGPNGWTKMSVDSGHGTTLAQFFAYSRGDPARSGNALATTNPVTSSWGFGVAFQPHFGGSPGSPDCALHNSWIAFKNIHVTGYLR